MTIVGAGTCTIAADQAGGEFYNAATQVTQSFTVAKAAQTITFGALPAKTFGDGPFAVGATSSSGLTVSFAASGNCTIAGTTVTITGAGSCTVTASQAGNGNYQPAADVAQSFAIAQAAQTITFVPVAAQTYSPGGTFGLSATATGGAVTFTSLSTAVCTVAGSTATIVKAGDCVIRADQAGTSNYAAATTQQTVAINKAAQTISFPIVTPAPTFKADGTGTFPVSATAPGGTVTFTVPSTTGVCTVSDTTVTMKSAGDCTIAADQAGGDNYLAAAQVVQTRHHRQGGADDQLRRPGQPDVRGPAGRADRHGDVGRRGGVCRRRQLHGVRIDADADGGRQLHDHRQPGGQHELPGGAERRGHHRDPRAGPRQCSGRCCPRR